VVSARRLPAVLVLAGGASNRFWPLEDKPFFPFAGVCLLERHVRMLAALGCERFVVVVRPGLEGRAIEVARSAGAAAATIVKQDDALGMAGAVLAARFALESLGEVPLYVTQAQDVVEPSLHEAMLIGAPSAFGTIAAARVKSHFPGGYLVVEGERIAGIVEKPAPGSEPSDLVNLVAHYFASWRPFADAVAAAYAEAAADDAYERALAALMKREAFRPLVYEGRWQALKYPWHVLDVADMLMDQWRRGRETLPEGYEVREDGVIMGRDVRIFPGSHVVAPALIGHGAVIGHNALVRGSMVGARSVVGFGSEVARSYLGEGVELHHNYVGDSVMADGTSMGFGGTTANYRLDGRTVPSTIAGARIDSGREKLGTVIGAGAKLGVNTSIMPGVKIGAGAIIGPNLRINRDVPGGARVLDDDEYGRF
jgi:NDP-sugar pyrophosphorylase family protein